MKISRKQLMGAVVLVVVPMLASTSRAGVAYALTSNDQLVQFDTSTPGTIDRQGAITGLNPLESLLGIDVRPADPSNLYATSSFGQTYMINPATRFAAKVGAEATPEALPLEGRNYGFSFNPTVDRIRLVSDLGENYRLNPVDGSVTAIDGNLTYRSGDVNAGFPAGVVAVGYTNQDNDPSTDTELYGIDSEAGVLVKIDPPNAGTLATVGSLQQSDLPLFSALDIENQKAYGFTTFEEEFGELPSLRAQLFEINLLTGQAASLGLIGDGSLIITGGAVTATVVPVPPAVFIAPIAMALAGYASFRARRRQAVAMG